MKLVEVIDFNARENAMYGYISLQVSLFRRTSVRLSMEKGQFGSDSLVGGLTDKFG